MVLRKRDAFESDLDETYSASGYRDKKYFLDNLCFSGTAFCHDICKHSAWFLPYEVGKHEFRFICVFAKDKEKKMGMMDFYKNFEIWERTSTTFLVYDCGFTSSKRHFYFLLFSSVLCNLLIMSLLEKCMRSSSSCSN